MIYAIITQRPVEEGEEKSSLINFFGDPEQCDTLAKEINERGDIHPFNVLAIQGFVPIGNGFFYKKD